MTGSITITRAAWRRAARLGSEPVLFPTAQTARHRVKSDRSPEETDLASPLLTSALEVFGAKGYHGTSVRDILERAQVTAPTLYYRYSGKEELFLALLEYGLDVLLEACRAAMARELTDPGDQFAALYTAVMEHVTERTDLASLDDERRYLGAESLRAYAARRHQVEDLFVGVVNDGIRSGDFKVRSASDATRAVLGLAQSAARWFRPTGAQSAEAVAEEYVAYALAILRSG